jgi:sulfur carrier protein
VSAQVTVNGAPRELAEGTTVAELLELLGDFPEGRGVAVAVSGEVVPRGRWASTRVADGSVVEVVAAVQGG